MPLRIERGGRRTITAAIIAFAVLAVVINHVRVRLHVTPARIQSCGNVPVSADVAWMVIGTHSVRIFVYGVGEKPRLWTVGGWRGKAKTGAWVSDGTTVLLTDASGKPLARRTIEAVACPQ